MSEQKTTNRPEIIKSRDELLTFFGMPHAVDMPEFRGIVEFTKNELELLRQSMHTKEQGEILKELRRVVAEKMSAKKLLSAGMTTELAGAKIEGLRHNLESGNIEKLRIKGHTFQISEIAAVSLAESIESQKDKIAHLEGYMFLLVQYLSLCGVNVNDLNLQKLVSLDYSRISLDTTQRATLGKLKEIVESGDSSIARHFLTVSPEIFRRASENADGVRPVIAYAKSGKTSEKSFNQPSDNGVWGWIKEHKMIAGSLAVAGALGLGYFVFGGKGESTPTPSSESAGVIGKAKSWVDKISLPGWLKWVLGIGAGVFGVGQILGLDGVKSFFKDKLGFDIDENRITKALELAADGHFIEACKVLIMGTSATEVHWNADYLNHIKSKLEGESFIKEKSGQPIATNLIDTIKNDNAKDFLAGKGVFSHFFDWSCRMFKGKGKSVEEIQVEAIRDFLRDKTKGMKMSDTTRVADILLQLYPDQSGVHVSKERSLVDANGKGLDGGVVAAGAAVAGVGVVAGISGGPEVEKQTGEGLEATSLGNPVLYFWSKGKRYALGAHFTQWSLRKHTEGLEKRMLAASTGGSEKKMLQQSIKEMLDLERMLQAGSRSLSDAEKIKFKQSFDKFVQAEPTFKDTLARMTSGGTLDDLISNPRQRADILAEAQRIEKEQVRYLQEMESLRKKKMDRTLTGERALREKMKTKSGMADYDIVRGHYLKEIQQIDADMARISATRGKDISESLRVIDDKIARMHLSPEHSIRVKQRILSPLQGLGVTLKEGMMKIPGAKVARMGLKVGVLGLMSYSIIQDYRAGNDRWKWDLTEAGVGMLPIASEVLDFKAAITGRDLAGRNLDGWNRFLRAGFGVVGTVADAATLLTLGQSQWLKAAVIGAKGARAADAAVDVGRAAKVIGALSKGAHALEMSANFGRLVRGANTFGKVLTFSALGVAVYDTAHDLIDSDAVKQVQVDAAQATKQAAGAMEVLKHVNA